jgi:iron-sulfur cluster insertion protein
MMTLTPTAENTIRELMRDETATDGRRVSVKGGGGHGSQYGRAFESKRDEDDTGIEQGDVTVLMDSQSAPLLAGCDVEFHDSVHGSGVAIKTPQANTTCGCGSSFSA